MVNNVLANLYERDLRKLIEEVNLFQNEENLWKTTGTVKNSSGNLTLHIIGGLNHFVGATLANSGYVRDRPQEFARKGVPRHELVAQLEILIPLIRSTLNDLSYAQMDAEFPILFDDAHNSNSYVLIRMYAHLDYHLVQINYL